MAQKPVEPTSWNNLIKKTELFKNTRRNFSEPILASQRASPGSHGGIMWVPFFSTHPPDGIFMWDLKTFTFRSQYVISKLT